MPDTKRVRALRNDLPSFEAGRVRPYSNLSHRVEQFGVAQAETYQDKIDEMIALIGDSPEIARLREEISPPVRIHPIHAHVIIYLVDDHRIVRILRVRHGRENWPVNPIA